MSLLRILSGLCLFTTPLLAVKTAALRQATYDDFIQGELNGLQLSNLGELSPGITINELAEIDADSILAAVEAKDGTIYLGTGSLGKVFKIRPGGEPELILEPREVMTRALAIGPDGALYAGTSPGGRLYRIEDGQRPEVYFDPQAMYIWDVLFDADGSLFVATGNDGTIYRLPPDFMPGDEAEIWLETDRTHVTTLAFDNQGVLLAGAGPKAYLYRIAEAGKGEVLFNVGTDEIGAIEAQADGTVLFSTLHKNGPPPTFTKAGPLDLPVLLEKINQAARAQAGSGASSASSSDDDKQPPSPTSGPSFLYRVTPEGFGEPLWSPGSANILSFTTDESGGFLLGTDDDAKLFTVQTLTDWQLSGQAESGGSISVILSQGTGGLLLMTSNPAKVYRAESSVPSDTQYVSAALDAGAVARWGRLLPVGTAMSTGMAWRTRTGNSPEPDGSWSEWQTAESLAVSSPPGRYLQYETTFSDKDAILRELRIFYAYHNAAPVVNRINILPVGIQVLTLAAPPKPPINLNQLTSSKEIAADMPDSPQIRTQVRFTGDAGAYSFGWNAFDPNEDSLTYTLAIAPEGSENYTTLVDDLADSVYSTSMRGFADGYYRVQVTASDAGANPPGEGLTGSLISRLFLVDNTSPVITVVSSDTAGDSATVVFEAKDALSIISAASYTLDGKPSRQAFPVDGFFDATEERFVLSLKALASGAHSLLLEVADESGNKATATVHLTTP